MTWLGAMNDVRLALGVRLKVEENTHLSWNSWLPMTQCEAFTLFIGWLGWLQESLIDALMDESQ
jgi:hypothetical protein